EVSPCALHYVEQGRAIIVSYIYHGIICWDAAAASIRWKAELEHPIGRTALSSDGNYLIAYNLSNGFTCYRIDQFALECVYKVRPEPGVLLPSLFLDGSKALLFGQTEGNILIVNREDGSTMQTLCHSGEPASTMGDGGCDIIATGSSERGAHTLVRVW
ncbi:hypothetical protein C8Q76DRAFT_576643, partial [Earliella scabrosa]